MLNRYLLLEIYVFNLTLVCTQELGGGVKALVVASARIQVFFYMLPRGRHTLKKGFFSGWPTKGAGRVNPLTTKQKTTFFL